MTFLRPPWTGSPSGSSVHWISQASILEWVVIPFPGNLAHLGIEPASLALTVDSFPLSPWRSPAFFVGSKTSFDRPANYFLSLIFCFYYFILFHFSQSGCVLSPGYWQGAVGGENLIWSTCKRRSRGEAGGKGSRLRSPTPCAVPECREHNFQHTLSSEELSGSQPACKAQGQAATMTVSIQENLGEPEEVRQVEGQLVSSAELSARYCGFVDGRGSSDCWEGLIY